MSEQKRQTVAEYVATHPRDPNKPFKPGAAYNQDGDFVEAWFSDLIAYTVPVSETMSLIRSMASGEIVGVKIYGIKGLVSIPAKEG